MSKSKKKQSGKAASRVPKLPRQTRMPGVDEPAVAEIDDAMQAYAEVRDARARLSKKEAAAQETLMETMRRHDKRIYHSVALGKRVVVVGKEKAKVEDDDHGESKRKKDKDDDGEES